MAIAPQHDPTNVIGRRIGAFFIDAIPAFILMTVLFFATAERLSGVGSGYCDVVTDTASASQCLQVGDDVYVLTGSDVASLWGIGLLYSVAVQVVMQGLTGASIGKQVLGLRVVNAAGEGCGLGRALVRWLLFVVDGFCFGAVGLIVVLATRPHRRVGDLVAGTYVVGAEDLGRPVVAAAPAGYVAPAAPGAPGGWAPPAPPGASPAAPPAPPPGAPPAPPPVEAGGPQWDPTRNAWVQRTPDGRWLRYDDATREWRPLG